MSSSLKKGTDFEKRVFEAIKEALSRDCFIVGGNRIEVHHQKGYYSILRKSNIIIDISVEKFIPEFDEPSLVVFVECKNYKKKVTVDDVEEFATKLRQISGFNAKGIMITTVGFQKGAFEYGKSTNIALALLNEDNAIKYLTPRIQEAPSLPDKPVDDAENSPIFQDEVCDSAPFIALYNSLHYFDIFSLLKDLEVVDNASFSPSNVQSIPYLSNAEILSKADELLDKASAYSKNAIDLSKIIRHLESSAGITFNEDLNLGSTRGLSILGSYNHLSNSLNLNVDENLQRKRFTLAHELGHYMLHSSYFHVSNEDVDPELALVSPQKHSRLEYQANVFASYLLLPPSTFLDYVNQLLIKYYGRSISQIFVDNQSVNWKLFNGVLAEAAIHFDVSPAVVEYRLKDENILVDKRIRKARNIFNNVLKNQ